MVSAAELLLLADRLATLAEDMGIEGTASAQTLAHVADYLEEAAGQQAVIDMRRQRCADYGLTFSIDTDADLFVWRPASDIVRAPHAYRMSVGDGIGFCTACGSDNDADPQHIVR